MALRFHEQDVRSGLRNRRKLSAFVQQLIRKHLGSETLVSMDYVFCTDDFLLQINQRHLDHDTLTDIITFDLTVQPGELMAELYISTERVKENAKLYAVPYQEELHRVIFHGALHLCGFGDKTKKEQEQMRSLEADCLQAYTQFISAS